MRLTEASKKFQAGAVRTLRPKSNKSSVTTPYLPVRETNLSLINREGPGGVD